MVGGLQRAASLTEPGAIEMVAFTVRGRTAVQFDVVFVPEPKVFRVRVWGSGGPNLVVEMVAAIRSAPEFLPGMGVLIDAFTTDYAPSTSEAKDIPALFRAQLPGSRLALMVRSGPQYNVACLVEAIAVQGHVPFAVFQDRADAMRWLTERTESVDPGSSST
jgi:hypothetical protein